ncbi:MAG TPA: hypothetical protein VIL74_11355 [Pyrinomonadaceae bacterium]|jgi:hypothetical protein
MNDVETTVVNILAGPEIQKINSFTFYGKHFTAMTFGNIKSLVESGFIKVAYDEKLNGQAAYDYGNNTLYLGFKNTTELTKKALVVHEAVHAVYDMVKMKMSVADSEAIAYIVQCQYARANSNSSDPNDRLFSSNKANDKVFEVGWRIAGKLLGKDSSPLTDSDYAAMREAVSQHTFYAGKAAGSAGFNG